MKYVLTAVFLPSVVRPSPDPARRHVTTLDDGVHEWTIAYQAEPGTNPGQPGNAALVGEPWVVHATSSFDLHLRRGQQVSLREGGTIVAVGIVQGMLH